MEIYAAALTEAIADHKEAETRRQGLARGWSDGEAGYTKKAVNAAAAEVQELTALIRALKAVLL